MLEKRPVVGKGKRSTQNCQTTIRLEDGRTVDFPVANVNAVELAKALTRRRQRRAAARPGRDVDNASRTSDDIRERMRRDLAAREHEIGLSIPSSDVEQAYAVLPGGWTLDVQ